MKGFTLIELLITIAIVGILAAIALPLYFKYTRSAYFTEVVQATTPYKSAVEGCVQRQALTSGAITGCGIGSNGVPTFTASGNVASITVSTDGVITATGGNNAPADTFVLTPAISGGKVVWTVGGTCLTAGTCQ